MGNQGKSMHDLEERLHGIATRDISDDAREQMEQTIDLLADRSKGGSKVDQAAIIDHDIDAIPGFKGEAKWVAAAALALLAAILFSPDEPVEPTATLPSFNSIKVGFSEDTSAFTLLKSVNRINGHEDDGLIIPADGSAPHYRHRYHIVDEKKIRDAETGAVITIRQPRQEVITVPVTRF